MNVFVLDRDPVISAQMHCDKHVVKMIIEYAQLMSTAHRVLDGALYIDKTSNNRNIKRWRLIEDDDVIYKASHINHPSNIWARESSGNYEYLFKMWIALCNEYTVRYARKHLTQIKLESILINWPANIPYEPMTEVPQAMPDDSKLPDPVDAYRNYYNKHKNSFAKWTNRQTPDWFIN
jgi:hypothetical protein